MYLAMRWSPVATDSIWDVLVTCGDRFDLIRLYNKFEKDDYENKNYYCDA
ncbi:MAG: hypothetical protein K6B67_00730 [Lachnospiraceae bacterium]|nr:hypothetical protein [Lachnospiraceae bacterium]